MVSTGEERTERHWRSTVVALIATVIGLAILSTGCGKTGISEDAYEEALSESLCTHLQSCCEREGESFADADCTWAVSWFIGSGSAGRTYDSKAAEKCIQAIERSSCALDESDNLDICTEAHRGTIPAGQRCTSSDQCLEPSPGIAYCDNESESEGRCVQIKHRRQGESCGVYLCDGGKICNHGYCADGLFCNEESFCELPRSPGQSCISLFACQRSLLCLEGTCTNVREGDSCESEADCPGELRCSLAWLPDAEGTCAKPGTDGDLCDFSDQCLSGICAEGLCASARLQYCSENPAP